jgi:hypothetical protein
MTIVVDSYDKEKVEFRFPISHSTGQDRLCLREGLSGLSHLSGSTLRWPARNREARIDYQSVLS